MASRRRRGAQEGSIYRRKDGRWVGSLTVGYNEEGRRQRRDAYGPTRSAVAEELARLQANALNGTLGEAGRMRVGAYLERWLEDSARTSLRESTYRLYRGLVIKHLKPRIGGIQLAKLTPVHVQQLYSILERDGASPRLRQIIHHLLRNALRQAVKWNLIARNPCDAVDRPRAPKKEVQYLNREQTKELLAAAKGHRLEALYVLAVTTGMRQGELLGLQWGDIDLEAGTLSVRRQLAEHPGRLEFSEPKSAKSRRQISLSEMAVEALREHRRRLQAIPHTQTLVFTNTHGGPIRKSNLVRQSFLPLLRQAGLERIRFHDLRHTAATLALEAGVHPKVVSEMLGHGSIVLTLETYSHALPSLQREAAAKLDALLGGH